MHIKSTVYSSSSQHTALTRKEHISSPTSLPTKTTIYHAIPISQTDAPSIFKIDCSKMAL